MMAGAGMAGGFVMEEYETDMIEQSRASGEVLKDMNVSDDNELTLNMEE
jgi:hypothetical protein